MKKIKKVSTKFLSVLLAVLMIFSTMSVISFAEDLSGKAGDNITWTFDEDTSILYISGEGDMYDFSYETIPWESKQFEIKKVVIEDGVTSIGNCSFFYCFLLEEAVIPEGVTVIGDDAFNSCLSLKKIDIPSSVEEIGEYAFTACIQLEKIVIPTGIKKVGDMAFMDCLSLKEVVIESEDIDISDSSIGYTTVEVNVSYDELVEFFVDFNTKEKAGELTEDDFAALETKFVASDDVITVEDIEIIAVPGSAAEKYAQDNGIAHVHAFIGEKVDPTCFEDGYTVYTCACGESYVGDVIEAVGHVDEDGDTICDVCTEKLDTMNFFSLINEQEAPAQDSKCDCICHKTDFISRIMFLFSKIFWRIGGKNKTCACGAVHY